MPPYEQPPLFGFKGLDETSRENSRASARAAEVDADGRRGAVLDVIRNFGAAGCTADEAARVLRWDILSVRPRVTELKSLGLIRPDGRRRKTGRGGNSAVMIAAPTRKDA